jgi:hypothetical protein
MSTWTPTTTVNIGGVDYTGDTVGTVTINRGRDNVYADPTAGFAAVQLIDKTGVGITLDPAEVLTIDIEDSAGDAVRLFTGAVTDITKDLYDPGLRGSPAAVVTVAAVGPLARLSRVQVLATGRPAETDGERIAAALETGLGVTWEELPYTVWDDIPAELTWVTFSGGYDPDIVDAGLFDLIALPAQDGGHNALTVALDASRSGQGYLYETPNGLVGWENADDRSQFSDFYDIPANLTIASQLTTRTSLADIVNLVDITYDGGVATLSAPDSIGQYGRWERRIETLLVNQTNAEQYADDYIRRHAFPAINLEAVTIRLDGLDDTLADELLDLDLNGPVNLEDVPATFGLPFLPGFIEGLNWRIDAHRAELNLLISDANLSTGDLRWSQIGTTVTWDDLPGTLVWQDWR